MAVLDNRSTDAPATIAGAVDAAHSAGLRYVNDLAPGIRRVRSGTGFRYVAPGGSTLRDAGELRRIRSLAIPPAWTDVWICPNPLGHIQAIGRDARGRKQYRYHPRWREVRDETKYGQLIAFCEALPALRRRIVRDLARKDLPREKVLATVVRLLETTRVRVGNEEYARTNGSFGLTTLRDHHVTIAGDTMRFQFRGKSGKHHAVRVSDRRVANIVRACQDIPGHELFQYLDDQGEPQSIDSADVNGYLREIAGADITAKLFRTWAGTVNALVALGSLEPTESPTELKGNLVRVIKDVAAQLGNTPAVCRRCYIHPAVFDTYQRGALRASLDRLPQRQPKRAGGLSADERMTLAFLRAARRRQAKAPTPERSQRTSPRGRARAPRSSPRARPASAQSAGG